MVQEVNGFLLILDSQSSCLERFNDVGSVKWLFGIRHSGVYKIKVPPWYAVLREAWRSLVLQRYVFFSTNKRFGCFSFLKHRFFFCFPSREQIGTRPFQHNNSRFLKGINNLNSFMRSSHSFTFSQDLKVSFCAISLYFADDSFSFIVGEVAGV